MPSRALVALTLLMSVSAAGAQTAASDKTEAEAAMERARRAAAGPLKAIQQASRIRRAGEPDKPADKPAVAATAAAASVAAAGPSPQAATTAAATPGAVPAVPAARGETAVTVMLELATPAGPTAPAAEVTPLSVNLPDQAATVLPAMPAAQPFAAPLPMVLAPKLLSKVDPRFPPSAIEQGPLPPEVQADLSLRADGSVAAVAVVPPVPRHLQRFITAALEQWRYAPLPNAQVHRVRLVFEGN